MRILVANDDGIQAPGIVALAEAMLAFGQVTVVTPQGNTSAIGHRKTMHKPIRVDSYPFPVKGVTAYATSDAPSDAIAVALLGFLDEPPDLIVSGINRGPNMGQDLTYSGTVSAAFEAVIFQKPAIAFSLDNRSDTANYAPAAAIARQFVEQGYWQQLPPLTLLNVNIPGLPLDQIKGYKIVRQGLRTYNDQLFTRRDPSGRPYYWIGGSAPSGNTDEQGTDMWAVHHGYVSVSPIHLDMTNYALMQDMAQWTIEGLRPGSTE